MHLTEFFEFPVNAIDAACIITDPPNTQRLAWMGGASDKTGLLDRERMRLAKRDRVTQLQMW
jgi:hypothetical protein